MRSYVVRTVAVDPAFLVDHHVVVVHVESRGLVVVLHRHPHSSSVCLRRYPGVVGNLDAQADPTSAGQARLPNKAKCTGVVWAGRKICLLAVLDWNILWHCFESHVSFICYWSLGYPGVICNLDTNALVLSPLDRPVGQTETRRCAMLCWRCTNLFRHFLGCGVVFLTQRLTSKN